MYIPSASLEWQLQSLQIHSITWCGYYFFSLISSALGQMKAIKWSYPSNHRVPTHGVWPVERENSKFDVLMLLVQKYRSLILLKFEYTPFWYSMLKLGKYGFKVCFWNTEIKWWFRQCLCLMTFKLQLLLFFMKYTGFARKKKKYG